MEALKLERINRIKVAHFERLLLPHMPIQLHDSSSAERNNVEQYITDQFYASYQANVNSFLPYLLSSSTTDDNLSAVIGFQPATNKPLFLEQYLESNIESILSHKLGQNIARNKIVETGNLTSSRPGASQMLFILVAAILHQAGFEWVVFTATKQVKQLLEKLDLDVMAIGDANPEYLADKGQSWGSYYHDSPEIMTTSLTDGMRIFNQHHVIKFMLKNYQNTITKLAKQLVK